MLPIERDKCVYITGNLEQLLKKKKCTKRFTKDGKSGSSDRFYFPGLQKSLQMVSAAMKLKDACSLEGKL